jgi:PAS domain S-box-containing protein
VVQLLFMNIPVLSSFETILSLDSVKSAMVVSMLSVWVLIGLFTYLNRYTKRRYFTLWTVAWLFYGLWLSLNYGLLKLPDNLPLQMFKQWCVGVSATFLLWGSFRFLALRVRQLLLGLFIGFLLAWSYVGVFHLDNPLHLQVPIFGLIGIASVLTSVCFFFYRRRKGFIGATLLGFGFFAWGIYFASYPFFQETEGLSASGFFISAVLQLFIAVSMIILVLEEVRYTNQNAIRQIRSHKTEKAMLKTKVLSTEERYRSLFDQASEAIFIVIGDDLKIVELNLAAQRLLGISRTEAVHQSLRTFCQPTHSSCISPIRAADWCRWASQQSQLNVIQKNGGSTLTEVSGAPIDFDGQSAFQFFFREVTERSRLEQQLRQSEKLSALGQMISGVAHELNNPLAVIKGYLELMLAHHNLPPQTRADLEKVAHEGARAAKLVKNFLAFAREQPSQKEMMDVNDVIGRIAELRKFELQRCDIDVTLDLDQNVPRTYADGDQIQQILINLTTNAVQAMEGRPGPHRLKISSKANSGLLTMTVEDNGPGVPPEVEQKIFEPFFTTKQVGIGTGLGLSIAHSIMSEHRGKIYHQRSPLGGAAFILELPVVAAPVAETAANRNTPAAVQRSTSRIRSAEILVLDDEITLAELLCEMLTMLGHKAVYCLNPAMALGLIDQRQFDIVLSDYRMPVMNGQEFYRKVRLKNPALADRIIFLTGDTVAEDTHAFLEETGNLHLAKPFQIAGLEEAIQQILAVGADVEKSPAAVA